MKGLVIIPAHNEEQSIGTTIDSLSHIKILPQVKLDIIVILDYCSDKTEDVVKGRDVAFVSIPCHMGYAVALQTGLKYAVKHNYEFCVFFDADGQHDSKDIPRIIKFYQDSKVDMAIGSRYLEKSDSYKATFVRRCGISVFRILTSLLTGTKFTDTTSGFRLLSKKAMAILSNELLGDFNAETIIYLHYLGLKVDEFPISSRERSAGQSMHSFTHAAFYPFKTFLLMLVFFFKSRNLKPKI